MSSPLRVPAFRRLWVAGFISETGDWLLQVAMPIFVYQLTGSAVATSATLVIALLPGLVLGPVAGVLADRWDRRRVLLWVSVAQGVALLPLLLVDGPGDLVVINLVTAVQGGLAALSEPAKNALLPSLVAPEQVPAAKGLLGVNNNLARLFGASLGGVLLAFADLPGVLLVDAASFMLAAALLIKPLAAAPVTLDHPPVWRAWLDGLGEIRRSRPLRMIFLVTLPMALAQGMFVVLFVVFVTDRLGGGEAETGVLRGVQAVGALVAGALIGVLARRSRPSRMFGWALVVFAVVDVITWNSPALTSSLGWYVALFAVMGAPALVVGAGLLSVLQLHTPPAHRGRVLSSAFTVFDGTQAVGMLLGGVLVAPLGLTALLNTQAALYLIAGLIALGTLRDGRIAAPKREETECTTAMI